MLILNIGYVNGALFTCYDRNWYLNESYLDVIMKMIMKMRKLR